MFEPALDYVVAKIPRFPFDKFEQVSAVWVPRWRRQGKLWLLANIEESLLKACRFSGGWCGPQRAACSQSSKRWRADEEDCQGARWPTFYISEAIRRGYSPDEIAELTKIDVFFWMFAPYFRNRAGTGQSYRDSYVLKSKQNGFADTKITALWDMTAE